MFDQAQGTESKVSKVPKRRGQSLSHFDRLGDAGTPEIGATAQDAPVRGTEEPTESLGTRGVSLPCKKSAGRARYLHAIQIESTMMARVRRGADRTLPARRPWLWPCVGSR
jgi:hypothetical protein